jgi:hypothetical protein
MRGPAVLTLITLIGSLCVGGIELRRFWRTAPDDLAARRSSAGRVILAAGIGVNMLGPTLNLSGPIRMVLALSSILLLGVAITQLWRVPR